MNDDEAKKAMTALMMVMMLATQTHEVCTQCAVHTVHCAGGSQVVSLYQD